MIISAPGANVDFIDGQIEEALSSLTERDFLLLQLEIPPDTVRAAMTKARTLGIRSILNLSPVTAEGAELANLADYVIMNTSEMTALAEASEKFAGELEGLIGASSTSGQVYVVTKGKDGAIAVEPGGVHQVAAPDIVPVDTVGAGDTFAGYFAAGPIMGWI